MKTRNISLPYVNNARAILITLGINLAVVCLLSWPDGVTYRGVLWDSLFCAAITTVIDCTFVYFGMRKMQAAGVMPAQVPISRLMQRLPRNPVALGALYIVVFGALTVGANALVLWFFGMKTLAFAPWVVYKLIYTTLLSAKITEYVIFRYVQPDCLTEAIAARPEGSPAAPVRNPLPRVSVIKEIYGSVTGNIAMNILIGTALGGVVVGEGSAVIIHPTTVHGIPITGLVFGLIMGVLVTGSVLKKVNAGILAHSGVPGTMPPPDKRFSWMPKKKGVLIPFVCACTMSFSALALYGMMKLFGISVMNFFQFTVFITIYASLVGRALSALLVRRCMQRDYVMHVLKKAERLI